LEHVIAIPKAGTPAHVRENWAALNTQLSGQDLVELERVFPPLAHKVVLEIS
jgi:diketogulonate reductase-like aldo/keto reductase